MVIRKLERKDNEQLDKLIYEVEQKLIEPSYWLPITLKSREHFFDDEWTYFLGAFEEDKLVGALGLFFNENEYGESRRTLGINAEGLAEYGRAMVLPAYQNKGIMTKLSNEIIDYARSIGIKHIIATVHPDNISSQSVVKRLGFQKKAFIVKSESYKRDIMLLEIKNEK